MDSAATVVLLALLIAFVGDAAASCREVTNEEMLEYFCEGGHPADLTTIPETTEKLRITKMPLRRITADTFARFGGNLWVLSCSHCEITDIDANAFRRLVNLQQLSLDSNRLTTVKASWFEGLDSLTYLDLNYNDIRDIEDGVYKNLPSLVDLRISGNRLRCLNLDEMSNLRELKRMFLSENSEFACPHAVSKFLENQGVAFEQDPEWRRLASDTIDVHVPPSYVEEDRETLPAHRERLHPDRRPPPEESEGPYGTRDRTFYPDSSEHHSRHRRPPTTTVRPRHQEDLSRVEQIPNTRPLPIPSSHQVMPYSTPETPRAPPSEDIKMSGIDEPSRTGHTSMYPTYETTPRWSYPTPYPPYIPTRETTPYPSYPTSERSQVFAIGHPTEAEVMSYPSYSTERSRVVIPAEAETVGTFGRSSQAELDTRTYPLYVTTSDGLERTPHGSVQVTHPSSGNSDMVTFGSWSTDDSIEHPANPSWTREHHEQSRRPAGNDRATWSTKPPYYGHDPRKMIVEESSSETDDDLFVATDRPVVYDRSQTTTTRGVHYVRPSPPELMHSPSTGEFYPGPYYEPGITVHPPLQNYQESDREAMGVRPMETMTTTDEPLPECKNSAPKTRPAAALVTFIVVTVLGHAVVERF
ncbi:uncharacterized protein [Temnothorax longispinosus]|uniref:uncharacterized protein isoform X1 n=1 Tax=Temnothorax longispinosus TaxID=300112 RepID=UPI003A9A0919